jgi:tRNA A-37 threonylcarbamoyl transferase component Bud32
LCSIELAGDAARGSGLASLDVQGNGTVGCLLCGAEVYQVWSLPCAGSVACSRKARRVDNRVSLPKNAILDGTYCIDRVIGSGGFGVTYVAEDMHLKTTVALKEYYPADFGERDAKMSVRPRSERVRDTFEWGRTSFLNEAQTLARFRHPSIVRITRVFEAHGTAYMVMDYERGQSFEAWLAALRRPPSQAELDRIATPLLDALELLHAQSLLHRDIAPDNIIVRSDGTPVLLDFGAARQAVAQMSRSITRITKAGFSPHEQYALDSRLQGPWSDLYAFAATLYRAVTGAPPQEATLRAGEDRLQPAAAASRGRYRPQFLAAIDACLKVPCKDRPQSVAELRPLLLERSAADPTGGGRAPAGGRRRSAGVMLATGVAAAIAVLLAGGYGAYRYASPERAPATTTAAVPPPAKIAEVTPPPPPRTEQTDAAASPPSGTPSQSETAGPDRQRSGEEPRIAERAAEPPPKEERRAEESRPVEERAVAADVETKRSAAVVPVPKEPAARPPVAGFDGAWTFTRSVTERCGPQGSVFSVIIAGGVVHGPGGKGSVSPSGQVRFPGKANYFTGTLSANSGRGTYEGRCTGTFTARRR